LQCDPRGEAVAAGCGRGGGRGISEALIMEVLGGPGGNCHKIQAPNFLCPPSSP
jgi:hypothetical protein